MKPREGLGWVGWGGVPVGSDWPYIWDQLSLAIMSFATMQCHSLLCHVIRHHVMAIRYHFMAFATTLVQNNLHERSPCYDMQSEKLTFSPTVKITTNRIGCPCRGRYILA